MAGNDLGGLLGSLLGGGSQGGGSGNAGNILGALLGALGGNASAGGGGCGANTLEGLIGILTRSGLLDQAQSWVGTGENKPVSGAQIAQALPEETLQKVAQDAGVSTEQAADDIARSLPEAVDKLTPAGEVPKGGSIEDLIRAQAL
ncbi:YidB family protein [Streptomyces sp. NBC_01724]|uniref:YidB family protein n=1 Tax=Streptomyces sp. NBC_01724 TaxID=2975922 RepID=UPI002E37A542|nr:YidB family protein [Streptomyces sp. NBC_01724]